MFVLSVHVRNSRERRKLLVNTFPGVFFFRITASFCHKPTPDPFSIIALQLSLFALQQAEQRLQLCVFSDLGAPCNMQPYQHD